MTVTRACHGKQRHPTQAQAERHRQRLIRAGATPDAIETYPCKHCPNWHVGHTKHRAKRSTR